PLQRRVAGHAVDPLARFANVGETDHAWESPRRRLIGSGLPHHSVTTEPSRRLVGRERGNARV
ncbi:hypothetical protein ACFQDD_13370, partial [Halorubrum pallidum]